MGNVGSGSDDEQPPGRNDRDERPTPPKRPIRRGQVGQERGGSAAEAASCSGSAAEAASCSSSDDTGNIFACWGDPPSAAPGAPGPRVARLPLQYSRILDRDLKPANVLSSEAGGPPMEITLVDADDFSWSLRPKSMRNQGVLCAHATDMRSAQVAMTFRCCTESCSAFAASGIHCSYSTTLGNVHMVYDARVYTWRDMTMHNKVPEWARTFRSLIDVETGRIVPSVGGKECCWPWYEEFHAISSNMRGESQRAPRTAHRPPPPVHRGAPRACASSM